MTDQFARQSFLGPDSTEKLSTLRVGLVGYGGGGSHIGQQLAHIGVGELIIVDPDVIEDTNLNRLVGGTAYDVIVQNPKVAIAARTVRAIRPSCVVRTLQCSWHDAITELRTVHVLMGAVDSFAERVHLEQFARRFLIPYIDIGMDVVERNGEFKIIGQIVLSSPNGPCLRCLGLVDDEMLAKEEQAREYGSAGSRAQVVWPNGVLASTAVGLLIQLITPWASNHRRTEYLEYDGNSGTIQLAPRLAVLQARSMICKHFRLDEVGDPFYGKML